MDLEKLPTLLEIKYDSVQDALPYFEGNANRIKDVFVDFKSCYMLARQTDSVPFGVEDCFIVLEGFELQVIATRVFDEHGRL